MNNTIELTDYAYHCLSMLADMLDSNSEIDELKGLNQEQFVSTSIYYLVACCVMPGVELEVGALKQAAKMARTVKTEKDALNMAVDNLKRMMDTLMSMGDDDSEDDKE